MDFLCSQRDERRVFEQLEVSFKFFFFLVGYLLYSIVACLNMNHSQVYTCSLPPEPPLPPPTPSSSHPSRLSQNTGLSSLCHTENSHWLFILQTVMYMLQCCEFLPKVKGITALTPSVFIF